MTATTVETRVPGGIDGQLDWDAVTARTDS